MVCLVSRFYLFIYLKKIIVFDVLSKISSSFFTIGVQAVLKNLKLFLIKMLNLNEILNNKILNAEVLVLQWIDIDVFDKEKLYKNRSNK